MPLLPLSDPPTPGISPLTFSSFTTNGTGCGTSVSHSFSSYDPSTQSVFLTLGLTDGMDLYIGPGTRYTDQRKSCDFSISVTVNGINKRVVVHRNGTTIRGYARIQDASTMLTWQDSYAWGCSLGGGGVSVCNATVLMGPVKDGFFITHVDAVKNGDGTVGAGSGCGGGVLKAGLAARLSSLASVVPGIEDPEEGERQWIVQTDFRVEDC
ncbi:hypothetical protein EJ04DRAFT_556990 [Polyplosphaeria fusca]|uniref:Uncharacterized protein n=1 Tax=Polyplosphaeria fusca TaxID=682080 RepID=A0A9P4QIQ7_9PLEO|nr:hypothetical protein EJ04DRAFT_556990 [Polyplosphaeria fusca]